MIHHANQRLNQKTCVVLADFHYEVREIRGSFHRNCGVFHRAYDDFQQNSVRGDPHPTLEHRDLVSDYLEARRLYLENVYKRLSNQSAVVFGTTRVAAENSFVQSAFLHWSDWILRRNLSYSLCLEEILNKGKKLVRN